MSVMLLIDVHDVTVQKKTNLTVYVCSMIVFEGSILYTI
jgi:hypothetical protein